MNKFELDTLKFELKNIKSLKENIKECFKYDMG